MIIWWNNKVGYYYGLGFVVYQNGNAFGFDSGGAVTPYRTLLGVGL